MRDPRLASIEEMEGYRPRIKGEPLTAITSMNRLMDMHEAMDIEEEMARRAEDHARKKANSSQGRGR